MTTVNEVDRFERERRDADRSYNEALTALDRAIVGVSDRPLAHEDFDRLATALITFLQQITGFVESKDRVLASSLVDRIDTMARSLQSLDELRTHVGVLQRTVNMLARDGREPRGTARSGEPADRDFENGRTQTGPSTDAVTYVGFEDQFRGSKDVIRERVREYVPLFAGMTDVVDLGCGRGELLAVLKAADIPARGVDANSEMVAVARDSGVDAIYADALSYVAGLEDESIGGVIATQVVEHLEPNYLFRLLATLARKLRPGSPIVLETINPACWLAFFSSYIRDVTHVRPVHPDTLQYLLRANGFERVTIRYSAPVPDHMKMKTIGLPEQIASSTDPTSQALAVIAHTLNANAAVLNNLMFTHLDYAAIGYRA
jgi:SAM-dependent methyltransferase